MSQGAMPERGGCSRPGLACAGLLWLVMALPTTAADRAGPVPAAAKALASAVVRVDGKDLTLLAAYLFRAPDFFDPNKQNVVVLLVPQPLDAEKLRAAGTLFEAFALAPRRMVVEIRPDRAVALAICHDGLGAGQCYHTSLAPSEWQPGTIAADRVAGHVASFAGKEETVFGTFRLYYEARFDVTGGRVFATRR